MENLNLDQLFSKIKLLHNEDKDFSALKTMFDEKITNEKTYETKLYQTLNYYFNFSQQKYKNIRLWLRWWKTFILFI